MAEGSSDIEKVLARRHNNGADYWATPDGRVYVGNPYSTISSLCMLHELGVDASNEAVAGGLAAIQSCVRPDGRIRLAPKAPLYPCYTAEAARALCRFGLVDSPPVRSTISYLLDSVHEGGGWRCSFSRFGKGPETECANPGATLNVLDVLRFTGELTRGVEQVDRAVEFLLQHWVTRKRLGPCHWGIGEKFLQVEFPFLRYNIFHYVYVLSFYECARRDARYLAALSHLEEALDPSGQVVVERPHRGLKDLSFCAKGLPSAVATARYDELRANLVA